MACILKYMVIVLVSLHIGVNAEDEIFYGGSISYKLEKIGAKKIVSFPIYL